MSTINTNGIDVNYPIPGVNNSSQGFRDNFTSIKTNIDIAANEISDLQNKVVVKSALENTVINNDMANTLISNASTRSFRATTYNLGNALSGTVLIDVSLGDVQFGTIAGNVTFQFGGWAPTGTQSNVQLQLNISNSQAVINFPSEVVLDNDSGVTTLENFANIASVSTVSLPYGVTEVDYRLSTTDCGNTITIEPFNRPRQATQIQQRTPSPTGFQGDVEGTVAVDTDYIYVCTGPYDATTFTKTATQTIPTINLSGVMITGTAGQFSCSTSGATLAIDQPVTISGTIGGTGTISGYSNPTTYYIVSTNGSTTFTLSSTKGGAGITTTAGTPTGLTYSVVTNSVILNNTTGLNVNKPIIFSGTEFGNITSNSVYYIKEILSGTSITISTTGFDGIAGNILPLSAATGTMLATIYDGSIIWKRLDLATSTGNDIVTGNLYVNYSANIGTILTVAGNANIGNNLNINGNAVIDGNLTVNGTYTYENITSLAIEDPIISIGRGPNNNSLIIDDNKDRGMQLWYYSGSEKSAFIGWDDSQQKLIAASNVSIASELVTVNSYGNFLVGNIEASNANLGNSAIANYILGNLYGTANLALEVSNTSQPNITSVGTLINLTVNANVDAGNLNSTGQILANGNVISNANFIGNVLANNLDVAGIATIAMVSDIKIGGGLNGYYLVTDGTGNLSWVSAGGTGNGVVGGANTQIQFNNGTGNFAGAAGFTFDNVSNIMSTPGNINSLGNISAIYFIGNGSALFSLAGANVSGQVSYAAVANSVAGANVSGQVSYAAVANSVAGANVSGQVSNSLVAGTVYTGAQPNITSVGTLTSLTVSGNTTSNNLISSNYIIVSAANSITASGTIQGDATLLTSSINIVTTVPVGSGVKLPVAEAGMRIIVRNSTSTALNVYPNTGAAIEPALINTPYTLNATTSMEFYCSTGGVNGQWFTLL